MPTEPPPNVDLWAEHVHQVASAIEALNARIAHLAIDLGVSLRNDDELVRVLRRPVVPAAKPERRGFADFGEAMRIGGDPAPRTTHKWEELQGLLVLRYGLETHYVEEMGAVATRHMLIEAEEHLLCRGFMAGDDGIDLARLREES